MISEHLSFSYLELFRYPSLVHTQPSLILVTSSGGTQHIEHSICGRGGRHRRERVQHGQLKMCVGFDVKEGDGDREREIDR